MPAPLPPTSGYTYAVEFSVEEALAPESRVEFSRPVISYVDNFLHFPVGTPVPVGYSTASAACGSPRPTAASSRSSGHSAASPTWTATVTTRRMTPSRSARSESTTRSGRRWRLFTFPARRSGACRSVISRPGTAIGRSSLRKTSKAPAIRSRNRRTSRRRRNARRTTRRRVRLGRWFAVAPRR